MTIYTICIQGHLDLRWRALFDGFCIAHETSEDGKPVTLLTGPVEDASALYGLVSRFRDLGVELISLQPAKKKP
jgi:hypothetical protein